jgi:DNA-directed RNA polymerase subunit RPC12/RpoP
MDVICVSCGAKLKIREEKLPLSQTVKITCPKCKQKITIDTREPEHQATSEKKQTSGRVVPDYDEFASPLDFLEGGIRLALILVNDDIHTVDINFALDELSYKCISPSSIPEAMDKLLLHHFDLIILSEGFDGKDIENSPINKYLNSLSMSIRRKIFFVLLGDQFETMDNMTAFGASANLVVNPRDLPDLTLILKKAITDNNHFYKVFMDTLKETGKI